MTYARLFTPGLLGLAALFALTACGEAEGDEPSPQERCESDDLKAYLAGAIDSGHGDHSLRVSTGDDDTPGRIGLNDIRLNLGDAAAPEDSGDHPMILRLYDATSEDYLSTALDDLTQDGPLELTVVDATELPAGGEDVTRLNHHDCSIEEGTICVQIGFDATGDGVLFDDDDHVYNARGGSVTIEGFNTASRTFSGHWDVELGRNILAFNDPSQGQAQGCFRPRYTVQNGDEWPLN